MPAEMMQSEYDRIHNPHTARTCIVPPAQCIVTISGRPTRFGNCQLGKWITSTRSRGTLAKGMPLINPHAWRVHSSPAFSLLRDLTERKHTPSCHCCYTVLSHYLISVKASRSFL